MIMIMFAKLSLHLTSGSALSGLDYSAEFHPSHSQCKGRQVVLDKIYRHVIHHDQTGLGKIRSTCFKLR